MPGFIVQGGDPTGTGSGGDSIYGAPFKVGICISHALFFCCCLSVVLTTMLGHEKTNLTVEMQHYTHTVIVFTGCFSIFEYAFLN